VLAGGLAPDNVRLAIETVRPFGVDVSSGVEASKGIKDVEKMKSFIEGVKASDQ
jgi:phosphoribosylanthranilate isomerase